MATTITCPACGARLKLPANLPAKIKVLKCAKCKGAIPLPAANEPMLPSLDDDVEPRLAPLDGEEEPRLAPLDPPAPAQQALPPAPDPFRVPVNLSLDEPGKAGEKKQAAPAASADDSLEVAAFDDEPAYDDLDVIDNHVQEKVEEVEAVADVELADDNERDDESRLERLPRMLKQREWFVKPVSGSMFSLSYNVLHGKTRKKIGTAVERMDSLTQVARLFIPRRYLATRVEIRDEHDGSLVCTIQRPSFFFRARIDIYDPDDRLLGYLEGKIFTLMGGFWVYDAHGREYAEVKGQWRPKPAFHFRTHDGRELGQVMLESTATGKWTVAWFTEGFPWYVAVARSFADDPDAKMLMLGTAVGFDLVRAGQKGASVGVGAGRR